MSYGGARSGSSSASPQRNAASSSEVHSEVHGDVDAGTAEDAASAAGGGGRGWALSPHVEAATAAQCGGGPAEEEAKEAEAEVEASAHACHAIESFVVAGEAIVTFHCACRSLSDGGPPAEKASSLSSLPSTHSCSQTSLWLPFASCAWGGEAGSTRKASLELSSREIGMRCPPAARTSLAAASSLMRGTASAAAA